MTTTTIAGTDVDLNDEGFFTDPTQWNEAVAAELADDTERYLLIGDESLVRDRKARLQLGLAIERFPHPSARVMVVVQSTMAATTTANFLHRRPCIASVSLQV